MGFSNMLPVNTSGLQLITTTSATSGSTLPINDCFTSMYDNYKLMIDYFQPATAGQSLNFRLRVGGADAQGSDYYSAYVGLYVDGTSSNTQQSATTFISLGMYNSANSIAVGQSSVDVYAPNKAERTFLSVNATLYNGQFGGRTGMAEHNLTTAYTGFTLFPGSGNFSNIRVSVYGYRK